MSRVSFDVHATEQEDSADERQRPNRLSWNAELTDEVTLDSPIFQRRSVSWGGDTRTSPKATGILKRARSCGGECKDTQRALLLREQKLCRLLDRQMREEEQQAKDQKPLKIDVGATLNNVWDAIFISPLLGLVDQLKVTKGDEVTVLEAAYF